MFIRSSCSYQTVESGWGGVMVPISANHTNNHNYFYFSQYPFIERVFFNRLKEK